MTRSGKGGVRSIRPGSVFRTVGEPPATLRLRNAEWGTYFALSGEHTVTEVAGHLGLAVDGVIRSLRHLVDHGLIEERAVTVGDYLRAEATTRDPRRRTLAEFLRGRAAPSSLRVTGGSARDTEPTEPIEPAVSGLHQPAVAQSSPADALDWKPLPLDDHLTQPMPTYARDELLRRAASEDRAGGDGEMEVPPEAEVRRLSLHRLTRYLIDRAGDRDRGRLDLYRVLVRVDTGLLRRNGIETLRFDAEHRIEDPELQDAIARSVERTLGVTMPVEAWVAVAVA